MAQLLANQDLIELLIKMLTVCIGAATILWTMHSGIKTYKSAIRNKRDEQITNWLQLFAETNPIKRLSAIDGLVKNCGRIYSELFMLCGNEEDYFLRRFLEKALVENAKPNVKEALAFNQIYSACYMQTAETRTPPPIPLRYITRLKKAILSIRLEMELQHKLCGPPCPSMDPDHALTYMYLSSRIISAGLDEAFRRNIDNAFLIGANFYGKKIQKIGFTACALTGSILRHIRLFAVSIHQTIVYQCDFIGSMVTGLTCRDTAWDTIRFIQARHTRASYVNGEILSCDFAKSHLKKNHYDHVNVFRTSYNGATIVGSGFTDCVFKECRFMDTYIHNTIWENVKWYKNKIKGDFKRCRFRGVHWGGSSLNGSLFVGCRFSDGVFAGADLKNVRFVHCCFENVNFEHAKNISVNAFLRCRGAVPGIPDRSEAAG